MSIILNIQPFDFHVLSTVQEWFLVDYELLGVKFRLQGPNAKIPGCQADAHIIKGRTLLMYF